jgi:hypothetical protein
MAEYYNELLKLCGFEDEEIDKEKLRIEKAFQKLKLGPEDMMNAEVWVRQHHDIELKGVRKILGLWIKELIDLVLCRDEGKKVVYYGFPTIAGPGMAIKVAAPEQVYCSCPDAVLCHSLGQIFNKLDSILEAGEQNGLPPGHGLCTLQTIRVGGIAKGIIPVPDMMIMSSYYCDVGSKTDELLRERYGQPAVVVDGSMDSRWGEFPNYRPERVRFLGAELNKFTDKTREILGLDLTPEIWEKAMAFNKAVRVRVRELTELMKTDPQPVSIAASELATLLITASTGRSVTEGPEAVATLNEEVRERVRAGIGVLAKGSPRVMTFITSFTDPSIARMIENCGLAMPVMFNSATLRMRPFESTYVTIGEKRAEMQMEVGMFHGSYGLAKRWAEVVEDFKLDGSIWGYQFNCRPSAETSHLIPKFVTETTGKPCLSLEVDYYDSRIYGAEALKTRVEAFAEMLKARKAAGTA